MQDVACKNGKCDGVRHTVMLIWCSTLVPLVGTSRAYYWVCRLNSLFVDDNGNTHLLEESELQEIVSSVMRVGMFKFRTSTICSCLKITIQQYDAMALSNRQKLNREKKKKETQEKRIKRTKIIIDAMNKGCTYSETARKAKCSISTVKRTVKIGKQ